MNEFEYVESGWRYDPDKKTGWSAPEILEEYKNRWEYFKNANNNKKPLGICHESRRIDNYNPILHHINLGFAYSLLYASRHIDKLSFLDYGGGIGHYKLIAQNILPEVKIDYTCVDLPLFTDYGKQNMTDCLFYAIDNPDWKVKYDFVMASASLQYSKNWEQTIDEFANLLDGGKFLYVARLPIIMQSNSYVMIQRAYIHGYNTEYLGWVLNIRSFYCKIEEHFELVREFLAPEHINIVNAPEQPQHYGFLLKRK